MELTLKGILFKICLVCVDDVICYAKEISIGFH